MGNVIHEYEPGNEYVEAHDQFTGEKGVRFSEPFAFLPSQTCSFPVLVFI